MGTLPDKQITELVSRGEGRGVSAHHRSTLDSLSVWTWLPSRFGRHSLPLRIGRQHNDPAGFDLGSAKKGQAN